VARCLPLLEPPNGLSQVAASLCTSALNLHDELVCASPRIHPWVQQQFLFLGSGRDPRVVVGGFGPSLVSRSVRHCMAVASCCVNIWLLLVMAWKAVQSDVVAVARRARASVMLFSLLYLRWGCARKRRGHILVDRLLQCVVDFVQFVP
jgi:hypothetical protein